MVDLVENLLQNVIKSNIFFLSCRFRFSFWVARSPPLAFHQRVLEFKSLLCPPMSIQPVRDIFWEEEAADRCASHM